MVSACFMALALPALLTPFKALSKADFAAATALLKAFLTCSRVEKPWDSFAFSSSTFFKAAFWL